MPPTLLPFSPFTVQDYQHCSPRGIWLLRAWPQTAVSIRVYIHAVSTSSSTIHSSTHSNLLSSHLLLKWLFTASLSSMLQTRGAFFSPHLMRTPSRICCRWPLLRSWESLHVWLLEHDTLLVCLILSSQFLCWLFLLHLTLHAGGHLG